MGVLKDSTHGAQVNYILFGKGQYFHFFFCLEVLVSPNSCFLFGWSTSAKEDMS